MNILYVSIGLLDGRTEKFKQQTVTKDVEAFIRKLMEYTLESRKTGLYRFKDVQDVKAAGIERLAGNVLAPEGEAARSEIAGALKAAADALIAAEAESGKRIAAMGRKIPTGNLAAAVVRDPKQGLCVIFAKVDHTDWFDGESLTVRPGFSCEDRDIWKTAVIRMREEDGLHAGDVSVYMDRPAAYWTGGFLGLEKVRSDEDNTRTALARMQKLLARRLSGIELFLQWNMLLRKMKAVSEMNYPDFINGLFGDAGENRTVTKLRDELLALPEKAGFDTQFHVVRELLPGTSGSQMFELNDYMKLTLCEGDYDPHTLVEAREESSGERFLVIRCTDPKTFEDFKGKKHG